MASSSVPPGGPDSGAVIPAAHRADATLESSPIGAGRVGRDGTWRSANAALAELLNHDQETLVGRMTLADVTSPDDVAESRACLTDVFETGQARQLDESLMASSGRAVPVRVTMSRLDGDDGPEVLVHVEDRTAEVLAIERSESTVRRYEHLLANASDVLLVIDDDGDFAYVSPNVERLLGFPAAHFLGRRFTQVVRTEAMSHRQNLHTITSRGGPATILYRVEHADGTWRWIEAGVADCRDDPLVEGFVVNARDVTDRVRAESALRHQASHDALTGLPNRSLLMDRVQMAIARSNRMGTTFAVLFCDLDHFKRVNDTLGHDAGDALLLEASERLQSRLRGADTLARIGGDEFVVVLEQLERPEADAVASGLAVGLIDTLTEPFQLSGHSVTVSASVGIAVYQRGQTVHDLLRDADVAMYAAKEHGRAQATLYDEAMRAQTALRFQMDGVLRRALAQGGVVVEYQPIVSLPTGRIIGAEALVRIELDGVRYPPGDFIDAAEESGLIVPLGEEVLITAAEEAASWAGDPYLSVNVSARQLTTPGLLHRIADTLALTGLPPERLVIEVTETALVEMSERMDSTMADLAGLGVRIALDDFGTGWSSLSYLRRFPVSIVKIDRTFVDGSTRIGSGDLEVIRAVIGLADALGIEVIGEGIETDLQAAVLTELGCHHGQGFLFGRPAPTLVRQQRPVMLRGPAAEPVDEGGE